MFGRIIADRYANAVLQNCRDLNDINRAKADLALLSQVYWTDEATRRFLLNPKIPATVKQKVLERALSGKLGNTVLHLLLLLIEKRRQDLLPAIAERFSALCDNVQGVEHARIISAVPLSSDLADRLSHSVQRFSARKVEVEFRVDPGIVGGVIIRLGDRVIDGSLAHRFEQMRRAMLTARVRPSS
jgi:F-type H+-transporting ATPase subunit delta